MRWFNYFSRQNVLISLAAVLLLGLFLAACADSTPVSQLAAPTLPPVPSATFSPTPTSSRTPTPPGYTSVWENFPPPQETPSTPIPPPLTGLVLPEEVKVMVIAGVDNRIPFTGRTDAVALVIYHPRLARASLVSIPPDLFGYIPGYTMQRLYTAYARGGPSMLENALEYNLGLKTNTYAVFNLDSFSQLIDDLGGIEVSVLENMAPYCPGMGVGSLLLHGDQAICYMRLRLGEDERARNSRQQQVLRAVFFRLVEGGNMARVPALYQDYRSSIDSNVTLDQLAGSIPLALKLGDPSRIGYFELSDKEMSTWQISQQPPASVFLPNRPALMAFMQKAINFVTTPSPLSEVVVTLEYELTVSPTPTSTPTITPTPTTTRTPTRTSTLLPTRTITPSPTVTLTP